MQFIVHAPTIFFLCFFMYIINKFKYEMRRLSEENAEIEEFERQQQLDDER